MFKFPKIFVVGTACSGVTEVYNDIISRTGLPGCNEKYNQLLIDCVLRGCVSVDAVLQTYCNEEAHVDKSHLNLWMVESLADMFPTAIFVALKRNVNLVVSQMLRMQSAKDWCTEYRTLGITFPSKFLGSEDEDSYVKLPIKDRCKARVLSHYKEIDRLSVLFPTRFVVINFDDKVNLSGRIDEVVSMICLGLTQPPPRPPTPVLPRNQVAMRMRNVVDLRNSVRVKQQVALKVKSESEEIAQKVKTARLARQVHVASSSKKSEKSVAQKPAKVSGAATENQKIATENQKTVTENQKIATENQKTVTENPKTVEVPNVNVVRAPRPAQNITAPPPMTLKKREEVSRPPPKTRPIVKRDTIPPHPEIKKVTLKTKTAAPPKPYVAMQRPPPPPRKLDQPSRDTHTIDKVNLPIDPTYYRTDYPANLTFYWINLERAPHRRERMEEEFKKRQIKNCRVTALDGLHTDLRPFLGPSIPPNGVGRHRYEIATTLSHLKALHAFVKDGGDVGIICEDDLSFEYESLWKKKLQDQINEAPADWTVLQMGLTINNPKEWHTIMAANLTYHPRKGHWYSALSYAIKRHHAIKILTEHSIPCDSESVFSAKLRVKAIEHVQSERIVLGVGPGKYMVYPPVFTYPSHNDSFIHPSHLRIHENSKNMIAKAYINNRL